MGSQRTESQESAVSKIEVGSRISPMARTNENKRPWSPLVLVFLLIVLGTVGVVLYPVLKLAKDHQKKVEKTTFAKSVFYDLVDFDAEIGAFPGDGTAVVHQDKSTGRHLDLSDCKGAYSNSYFRQLIEHRKANSKSTEELDYSDFSYLKNQSSSGNPARPLILARMTGDGVKFDPEPYNDIAVVLRIDGSVKQYRINKSHLARISGGKTLFETGPDTVWGVDGFDPSMLVHPNPRKDSVPYEPSISAKIIMGLLVLGVIRLLTRKRSQKRRSSQA